MFGTFIHSGDNYFMNIAAGGTLTELKEQIIRPFVVSVGDQQYVRTVGKGGS